MLTVKQLLAAYGLNHPPEDVRLVRHSGQHSGRSIRQIIAEGLFDHYQADQDAIQRPFDNCKVIISFIGIEGNRAEFHGAYLNQGSRPFRDEDFSEAPDFIRLAQHAGKNRIWYDLAELPEFRPLRGRLIAQWATRGWYQTKDLPVEQLLPSGTSLWFPGYQDVVLNWKQLQGIIDTPHLHRDWKVALSSTAGIYRIVDHSSSKIYIGAAYGSEGLWGRWREYAQSGHGNNMLLKVLNADFFQWSIVRTLSGSMAPKEILRIEQIEKAKHGSLAVGLNLG